MSVNLNIRNRLVTALLLSACCANLQAQSYPSKPMQVIIPFGPGGGVDREGRRTASCLSSHYKQPVVVINKPGANSLIGAATVKTAAPDGYTLLFSASNMVADLALGVNPDFDLRRDLEPISELLTGVPGIFVYAGLPVRTMAELVAYAKANPGKLNYGTVGIGSINHLGTEALALTTGMQLVHVPYAKGGAGAFNTALMAGEIQIVVAEVSTTEPTVQAGKARLLAVMAPQRMSSRPDVPSLLESDPAAAPYLGLLWYGYFAPPRTPKEILDRNYVELRACMTDDEARAELRKLGYEPSQIVANRPEEFRAFINEEVPQVSELVKKAHMSIK